ncbi:MAG: hypothetical protein R3209_06715 [Salinimicrobium sediminis]|nr:hypothetical protein [Salinimicrobium sediminis]
MVSKSRNQIIVVNYTPSGIFLFNNCTPSKPTGFGFNISKDLCRHQLSYTAAFPLLVMPCQMRTTMV